MGIKRLVWAKFINAGQTCLAPDYILVDKTIESKFLKLLVEEIERHSFAVENDNYVQMVNEKNYNRVIGLIDTDKIYYGGERVESERLIMPTVLGNVTLEDKVMSEEIFGPLLPVLSYNTIDEAIKTIKTFEKPLSLYVHTKKKKIKNKILNEVSFGGGCINESVMHYTNSELPFGGVGQSGIGSYHGQFGFETFSHKKGILDKPSWFELNIKYYKRTAIKLKWIKSLIINHIRY